MRIDELSIPWLATALQCSTDRISELTSEPLGTGQVADCHRLHFSRSGVPESLVLKMTPEDERSRSTGAEFGNYRREVRFYQQLSPDLVVRAPRCHFGTITEDGTDFALLLEDLSPCRPGDQLSGCTVEEVGLVLDEAAKFHAPMWLNPRLTELSWLPTSVGQPRPPDSRSPGLFVDFQKQYDGLVSDAVVEVGTEFYASTDAYFEAQGRAPWSLMHADLRPDNILFRQVEGNPAAFLVDWQTVQRGPALVDIAYFVGGALSPADRGAHERDLVRRYHEGLLAAGVKHYTFEDCWNHYAIFSLQNMFMAVNASLYVERTQRGDEMFLSMAHNAAQHALGVDALSRLRAGAR